MSNYYCQHCGKVAWKEPCNHCGKDANKNEAIITYFGQKAKVACDRTCWKAWGIGSRPKKILSEDPDDYAFYADDELGAAPIDPGTYEGGTGKPSSPDEFPQKWCIRECERSTISTPGEWEKHLDLPDFKNRVFNLKDRKETQ